jgi:hypothetical protein
VHRGQTPSSRPLARDVLVGVRSRTATRNPSRCRKGAVRKTAALVGDHERGARGSDDSTVVLADRELVAEVDRRRLARHASTVNSRGTRGRV